MGRRILEVKHHLDGRVQTFECEAVLLTPDRAVVRFVNPVPMGDYPPGTVTLGFFWRRRPYNLYRLLSPSGELLGHRFDVVRGVRIEGDRVEYRDLLLDVRVGPGGEATVEDEDEVRRAAARGLLSPAQLNLIERTGRRLLAGHRRIIREALRSLPPPSPRGGSGERWSPGPTPGTGGRR